MNAIQTQLQNKWNEPWSQARLSNSLPHLHYNWDLIIILQAEELSYQDICGQQTYSSFLAPAQLSISKSFLHITITVAPCPFEVIYNVLCGKTRNFPCVCDLFLFSVSTTFESLCSFHGIILPSDYICSPHLKK